MSVITAVDSSIARAIIIIIDGIKKRETRDKKTSSTIHMHHNPHHHHECKRSLTPPIVAISLLFWRLQAMWLAISCTSDVCCKNDWSGGVVSMRTHRLRCTHERAEEEQETWRVMYLPIMSLMKFWLPYFFAQPWHQHHQTLKLPCWVITANSTSNPVSSTTKKKPHYQSHLQSAWSKSSSLHIVCSIPHPERRQEPRLLKGMSCMYYHLYYYV